MAEAIIINSESLRTEIERHLEVDPSKLRLIPEAVDHDLFKPGDAEEARAQVADLRRDQAVRAVRVIAVAVQELRRAAAGLGAHASRARGPPACDHWRRTRRGVCRLVARAGGGTGHHRRRCVFIGGIPLADTVPFYRAADVFVYPSFNETFGLPILEAMATRLSGRDIKRHRHAGDSRRRGRARGSLPTRHQSRRRFSRPSGPAREQLIEKGLRRAGQFTWGATAASTLDVYREVAERRRKRQK